MNGYLLDTHVLLWWLDDPSQLSTDVREAIADPSQVVYVSAATAWEMGIKKALGRLDIPDDLPAVLERDGTRSLPIPLRHGLAVADLPAHHADPFDRMMIAQAAAEDLVLVTRDPVIERYDIAWLKA